MTQSAAQLPDGRRPWWTRLIPGLFFLSLAILNTYPLAAAPGSFIGEHGDSYFSVWRLAWIAHQLWQRPGQLFNGNIFYPEKATLAYSDAILLPAIVVSPLHSLGVDPIVAYNLVLIAAFTLNGVAAYSLVRYLTGSMAAGLLGGAIFAFSPHRFDHFDHLEMQFAFWIPWAVLAWHKAIGRDEVRGYLRVAALVSAQVLSCIYYGVFLITWLGVTGGVQLLANALAHRPRRRADAGPGAPRAGRLFDSLPAEPSEGRRSALTRRASLQRDLQRLPQRAVHEPAVWLVVLAGKPRAAPVPGAGHSRPAGGGALAADQSVLSSCTLSG